MKTILYLLGAMLAAGCATQDDPSTQDTKQAVQDFIELRDLKELDSLKSGGHDGWTRIDDNFILYTGRKDTYLVQFVRPCWELRDNTRIIPDKRWDTHAIRSRFDTIRGCRIHRIYALSEAEVAELENIGEAPGSRN